MDDLTITRLCADAMGIVVHDVDIDEDYNGIFGLWPCQENGELYEPIQDDVQAMALVKKFKLDVMQGCLVDGSETERFWTCYGEPNRQLGTSDVKLNRAICWCVARMQEAKNARS
jgi:hypothetical protein